MENIHSLIAANNDALHNQCLAFSLAARMVPIYQAPRTTVCVVIVAVPVRWMFWGGIL